LLSDEQITQFNDEGFLVFDALLQGAVLQRYVDLFQGLVARAAHVDQNGQWCFDLDEHGQVKEPRVLHKIQGVCVVEPEVLELAKEPEICGRVAALLGPHLDIFGTKFFPMLPSSAPSTGWHQDTFYFNQTPVDEIISCAIYLEDTDRTNGCLRVIPGSHKQGPFNHVTDRGTYGSWVEADESQARYLEVPGGTVVLFSAHLLHGAHRNLSIRTRYSTAWHYIPHDLDLQGFESGKYADRHHVC
jgi:phytanoyl-CoA hydroxylase